MKRVFIKHRKKFIKEILYEKSIRQLSNELDVNYSTFKKWVRGEYTIPEKIFNKMLEITKDPNNWKKAIIIKEENWGAKKGARNSNRLLTKEQIKKKLEYARSKRDFNKEIKININKNFCEFYGALMGDGCIGIWKRHDGYNMYVIVISGHKFLDKKYHEYLKNLIKSELKVYVKLVEEKNNNCRKLIIRRKDLLFSLKKIGFPIGKKGNKLKIPPSIIKLPWNSKRYLIRGLFDTDGTIYAKKNEGFKYPHIQISTYSKPLIKQIYNILREKNYPVYKKKSRPGIEIRGIANTKRWMKDIGSSNTRHILKYQYWLKEGILPSYFKGP